MTAFAFGLALFGLLLDFTGWFTAFGALSGLLGFGFVLLMPRGRLRRTAFWLNLVTVVVAVGILLALFL